jgi:hypothetical protein
MPCVAPAIFQMCIQRVRMHIAQLLSTLKMGINKNSYDFFRAKIEELFKKSNKK